jgi:hypothetical protein
LTKEDLIVEIEAAIYACWWSCRWKIIGKTHEAHMASCGQLTTFIMEWLLEGLLRHIQESMKSAEMKCQSRILSVMQDRGTDLHNVSLQPELWKQVVLQEFVWSFQ